jgi:hypothetical protein
MLFPSLLKNRDLSSNSSNFNKNEITVQNHKFFRINIDIQVIGPIYAILNETPTNLSDLVLWQLI